jgi:hypothetical protein
MHDPPRTHTHNKPSQAIHASSTYNLVCIPHTATLCSPPFCRALLSSKNRERPLSYSAFHFLLLVFLPSVICFVSSSFSTPSFNHHERPFTNRSCVVQISGGCVSVRIRVPWSQNVLSVEYRKRFGVVWMRTRVARRCYHLNRRRRY